MNANDFHVGQLVSATDPATMTALCATYTHYSTHGIIVEVDEHRVDVKWIDHIGPQHQPYLLDPSLLRAGTLTTGGSTPSHRLSPPSALGSPTGRPPPRPVRCQTNAVTRVDAPPRHRSARGDTGTPCAAPPG